MSSVLAPASAAFADYFGLGAISPLLPFFVDELTPGDQNGTGLILTCQYTGVILGSLFAGFMSDKIGRRNTLLIALTGDVVFFTLSGFAPSITAMCVIRLAAGFFTPLAPSIAWLIDAAGDDDGRKARNQGVFGMSSLTGFMMGAAIGGFMGYEYFKLSNMLTGGFALMALVIVFRAKEPDRPNATAKPEGIVCIIKNVQFFALAFSFFVTGLQFTGLTTLVSVLMKLRFDWQPYQISIMFMSMTVMHFFFMANIKKLNEKFQTANLICAAYIVAIIAHVIFMFDVAYTTAPLCAALLLVCTVPLPVCMVCGNLLAPFVADKHGTNARGATVGICRTIFNVGQAFGPAYAIWGIGVEVPEGSRLAPGYCFFAIQIGLMGLAIVGLVAQWRGTVGGKNTLPTKVALEVPTHPPTKAVKGGWVERFDHERKKGGGEVVYPL